MEPGPSLHVRPLWHSPRPNLTATLRIATDMGEVRGEINIGQLCRERLGGDAALVGFGTDRGTVARASGELRAAVP